IHVRGFRRSPETEQETYNHDDRFPNEDQLLNKQLKASDELEI
ncbi:unnamed protein product, partial [Rotaria sordida]